MYIPRLRRISDAIKEIKKTDPDSAINATLIKAWMKNGRITNMKYGNAYVVNLDELYRCFKTKGANHEEETNASNERSNSTLI